MTSERNLKHVKVGDTLLRVRPLHKGPPEVIEVTVTKVAIKYLTVEWLSKGHHHYPCEAQFARESGCEKGSYTHSHHHASVWTAEGLALAEARKVAELRLMHLTRRYGWRDGLSVDQLTRIADIIEEP